MGVRYYVCALDIGEDGITAMSCPDEKTTQRACLIASQKMKVENGTDGFYFRCIEINAAGSRIHRFYRAVRSLFHSCLVHAGLSAWRDISPQGRDLNNLNIDELESAESKTNDLLHDARNSHRRDLRFMRQVEWVLKGCPPIEPEARHRSESRLDEPNNITNEIGTAALEDLKEQILSIPSKEDIKQAVYLGSLRALVDSKNPDEKYKHWVMSEAGIGHMAIAVFENPEMAKAAKDGSKDAKDKLERRSETIRMQISRMNEFMPGGKPEKSNKKASPSTAATIVVSLSPAAFQALDKTLDTLDKLGEWSVCESPETKEKSPLKQQL